MNSGFNINSILSRTSLNNISEEEEKELLKPSAEFKYISIRDLVPSEGNFYSMEQIQELKTAIELAGRVLENINVFPLGNGKYKVVAGHRRCTATWQLAVEEGKTEYEYLPCSVEPTEEDAKAQALREELLLLLTNSQREKTDFDKVQEVERLKLVLEEYKKREKLPGRMRELIAKILGTSSTQVERFESISKNLTPEFKQELKEQKVNISTAVELSKLPPEEQQQVYVQYADKGSISINEVKQRKAEQQADTSKVVSKAPATVVTKTIITEEVRDKEPEQVPDTRALNVYVCSAYGGSFENFQKAVGYCKYVASLGHIPYASHVMLHGILQDDVYEQRLKGLQAGFEMIRIVDTVWVFTVDSEITRGMQQEIDLAKKLGKTIAYTGGDNIG